MIVPIYTAEISPQATKGLFGASTQVMINLGILVAQVLGYFLSRGGGLWRVVLGVAGGIGVVQGGGLAVVPESPEWLAANGEVGVAKRVLSRIRGGKRIDREVGEWGTAEEGAGMGSVSSSLANVFLLLLGGKCLKICIVLTICCRRV